MNTKHYHLLVGLLFCLIAVLHLFRLLLGWEAVIGGWVVPMWLSWIAVVLPGYLGYISLKAYFKKK